jgi:hypothetical protein
MKFYVSAGWNDRVLAKTFAGTLEKQSHIVTTDWWNHEPPNFSYDQHGSELAIRDCIGIRDAHALILLVQNPYTSTGGALTELGIAIGAFKPAYVIGHGIDKNVFRYYPSVLFFETEEEFFSYLNGIKHMRSLTYEKPTNSLKMLRKINIDNFNDSPRKLATVELVLNDCAGVSTDSESSNCNHCYFKEECVMRFDLLVGKD